MRMHFGLAYTLCFCHIFQNAFWFDMEIIFFHIFQNSFSLNIETIFFQIFQNAFWFALGWGLFFFIPVIIVGVKLSKFYRKMNEDEGYVE